MIDNPLRNHKELLKSLNRSLILNAIKRFGPISRADVARLLGLSPATLTSMTARMLAEGLIYEKMAGLSSGGRPPVLLALNPQGGFAVGVKLTESTVIAALTDLEANTQAKASLPWDGKTPQSACQNIRQVIAKLIKIADINRAQVIGLGIGLAGVVDATTGIILESPFLPWKNLDLRRELESRLRIPVFVDNDVNTLTLAEKWFGAGVGIKDFLVVTIGRGVGMGIVVNGQLYQGKHGGAGELGHVLVDENGPLCACGKKGCLEAFISDSALLQEAARQYTTEIAPTTIENLVRLAEMGDEPAKQIFAIAGKVLGKALAQLINIFDPELIILGGEGLRAGEIMLAPMREVVESQVLKAFVGGYRISEEAWGDDAWARGAASLVLRELFESPVHKEENRTSLTVGR